MAGNLCDENRESNLNKSIAIMALLGATQAIKITKVGDPALPPQSMSHKGKKDVVEPGMEEEDHGFDAEGSTLSIIDDVDKAEFETTKPNA